jgi:hypothetical protein
MFIFPSVRGGWVALKYAFLLPSGSWDQCYFKALCSSAIVKYIHNISYWAVFISKSYVFITAF